MLMARKNENLMQNMSMPGATALAAGYLHTCALLVSGAVSCWGGNNDGQLGSNDRAEKSSVVAVTGLGSGTEHLLFPSACFRIPEFKWICTEWLGLTIVYDLYFFRSNCDSSRAQTHVCCNYQWQHLLLGQQWLWTARYGRYVGETSPYTGLTYCNRNGFVLHNVFLRWKHGLKSFSSGAVALAAGYSHTCALLKEGSAMCWGSNSFGQLGTGNLVDSLWPVEISLLGKGIIHIR